MFYPRDSAQTGNGIDASAAQVLTTYVQALIGYMRQ